MKRLKYYLIINTDSYSGNFERELCAHLTGAIGECEVGNNLVDDNIHAMFEPYIGEGFTDGCWRPVQIYTDDETDNGKYQSVMISLEEPLSDYLIEVIKERLLTFNDVAREASSYHKDVQIHGIKLLTEEITIQKIITKL